jgi:KDO2-lipid IV(A) lauroyltransferase
VNDASADTRASTRGERLAYLAFAAVAWLGRALPTHTGRMLFGWAGAAAYRLLPGVRGTVAENQARVLGREPDDPLVVSSTRRAFRTYARYWFDAFDVVGWSDERILRHFRMDGVDNLRADPVTGLGVVAVLPHMGNWDAVGRLMGALHIPVVSVAERLRPEELFRLFYDHRSQLGIEIVGLGEAGTGRLLSEAIGAGKVVALLADRDLTGRGIEVEMFGHPRRLPAGPALLALSTGAPVVVVDLYETADGWRGASHPQIAFEPTGDRRADATALTREIARAFERSIGAAPWDWHAFQPWGT